MTDHMERLRTALAEADRLESSGAMVQTEDLRALIKGADLVLKALEACRTVLYDRIPRIGPEGPNTLDEQAEYEAVGGAWSMADRAIAAASNGAVA